MSVVAFGRILQMVTNLFKLKLEIDAKHYLFYKILRIYKLQHQKN